VARRDAGLSDTEQADFERWLAEDPRHRLALVRFEETWNALARPRRTGNATAIVRKLGALDHRRYQIRLGFAGAALASFMVLGLALWQWRNPKVDKLSPAPQAVVVMATHSVLPDGSVVEFPAGAEFTVDYSGMLRRVVLMRGEAYFQVAKNPSRPFVVSADGIEVRAVGTAFSVQVGKPRVEVLVTEGRVSVDQVPGLSPSAPLDSLPRSLTMVNAGNRVVVDAVRQPTEMASLPVQAVSATEMAERLAWRNPRVEFSGAPLRDVIAVINRYNRVQFIIDDPVLASVLVSGLFPADDADAFLRMLEAGFQVQAERRDGGQILLRKSP
jgi:transmembrane sensor